ncbi:MAG: 2-C-methyl-D-erythritol 4-phosphate cytidylyltransferase [Vicinamibacterales bacterium]
MPPAGTGARVAAVIAAGGRGVRVGAGEPKQFLAIGGRSLLEWSVEACLGSPRVDEVVVALPADRLGDPPPFLRAPRSKPVTLVAGGARRQDSVRNAVVSLGGRAGIIVVHDAARPFVSADLIARAVDAAEAHGAALAALPVTDTVKQAGPAGDDGRRVEATLPRERIFLAQTPQAFRREVLEAAFEACGDADVTDEATLVERAGGTVWLVDGERENLKVTTADDLGWARARAGGTGTRVGVGYDLHRLVAGRPLILGGVRIDHEAGLDGHSDADIVCHAVTDAVLGAAALGDIGRLFPDTDARWKGADSVALLRGATDQVRAAGFRVVNVDVTVIAERPKLLPHLERIRGNLAGALDVPVTAVSVKGKTNEGVDSMGRGESMACHAVAMVAAG